MKPGWDVGWKRSGARPAPRRAMRAGETWGIPRAETGIGIEGEGIYKLPGEQIMPTGLPGYRWTWSTTRIWWRRIQSLLPAYWSKEWSMEPSAQTLRGSPIRSGALSTRSKQTI